MIILFSLFSLALAAVEPPTKCLETTHHADGSVTRQWVDRDGGGVHAEASSSSHNHASASSSVSMSSSSNSEGASRSSASSNADGTGRTMRVEQDSNGCRITIDERSPTGE